MCREVTTWRGKKLLGLVLLPARRRVVYSTYLSEGTFSKGVKEMAVDFSLLVLRVVIGLTLAAHGSMKLFGWFSSPGLKYFSGVRNVRGLGPPPFWGLRGGLAGFGGGRLVARALLPR